MAMRLLSYMLACADMDHKKRPDAGWLVEKLEEEFKNLTGG